MLQKTQITVVLLILFQLSIFAQENIPAVHALNRFVDYANQNIAELNRFHAQMDKFNFELDKSIENNKDFRRLKYKKFRWENYNSLYNSTLYSSKQLPKQAATTLKKHAFQLKNVRQFVQQYEDSIVHYLKKRRFKNDSAYQTIYGYLTEIEELYNNYDVKKEALYSEIRRIYQIYETSASENTYVEIAKNLKPLMTFAKLLVEACRFDNAATMNAYQKKFHNEIAKVMQNKARNLAKLSGSKAQVSRLYDALTHSADELYQEIQIYMGNREYENNYEEKGKDYYFYNRRFLPKYNQNQQGLVFCFNQLMALSEKPVLKKIEEPAWFKSTLFAKAKTPKKEEQVADNKQVIKKEPAQTTTLEGYSFNNLVFMLDVSGSMKTAEKLPVLKEAFKYLLGIMRPEDFVSIVSYSGRAKVVLSPTSSVKKDSIFQIVEQLKSYGTTKALLGLKKSYEVARSNFLKNGNNRVIMATDGDFQLHQAFINHVKKNAKQGISLTIIYLSKEENSLLAKKFKEITGLGNGNYMHVTPENAKQVLLQEARAIKQRQ